MDEYFVSQDNFGVYGKDREFYIGSVFSPEIDSSASLASSLEASGILSLVKDEKACFARVGKKCVGDYDISFSDSQSLQKLRQKLFRSIAVLNEYIRTVSIFKEHYGDPKGAMTVSSIFSTRHNLDELRRSASYSKNVF
ncbi:hypothetical protein F4859DRAFT_509667 [Xylaria cf. heliscus]|nr:hypothetical protein F4859DRAFT_509667 [Xylaria cf. heliscus]